MSISCELAIEIDSIAKDPEFQFDFGLTSPPLISEILDNGRLLTPVLRSIKSALESDIEMIESDIDDTTLRSMLSETINLQSRVA